MKKGKIHPSPAATSSPGSTSGDAIKVLRLLPAAILALTAVMRNEDKEVLAYLMTRSMSGSVAAAGEERRRCRTSSSGGAHRPALDCGCFQCYTSFWSRWDCSPNRELIHQVIEAFEEHLASSERDVVRHRRRDRAEKKGKRAKEEKKEMKKMEVVVVETTVSFGDESSAVANEDEKVGEEEESLAVIGSVVEEAVAADGEKRRGWADVIGIFNSRLWSLWSPGE
ncbi:hypothetical protein IHE45_10G015300 [Dioscorea alata]|uniref:Uncharacterized protein n=1 Tax=Dioscorea alata TaxID=55571 RepID=A0ACB7V950_DIOAL|nr:hypothetical protein IHE45_10G015300 [Dioscorea alata]